MKLMGRLIQLPDSQKVFGALVYMYAEYYSPNKASELVAKVKENQFHLSLSNLLPSGYLPVPHAYLLDQLEDMTLEKETRKKLYQAVKKLEYVKLEQLKALLGRPREAESIYPYVYSNASQQIHASLDSLRYDMPGLSPNLYSVPEITIVEQQRSEGVEEGSRTVVVDFSAFLSMDQGEESKEIIDVLNQAIQDGKLLFLGPRASQGLNTYQITNLGIEGNGLCETSNSYLNLGMLLPRNINYSESSLRLHTSERRPYHAAGGWDASSDSKFISFVAPGSIIYPEIDKSSEHMGGSIRSPFNEHEIVFGNSYLLPIALPQVDLEVI